MQLTESSPKTCNHKVQGGWTGERKGGVKGEKRSRESKGSWIQPNTPHDV